MILVTEVSSLYNSIARQFDRDPGRSLMERVYLKEIPARLTTQAAILDLGCGGAQPIAAFSSRPVIL